MKEMIKLYLRKIIPTQLLYSKKSYSQEGEDIVLAAFYEEFNDYNGFYVDIGAHHPIRFSNTYLFYKKGWKGINIEPTPGKKKIFDLIRARDINLEFGVGENESELTFYSFDEPALNGFSQSLSESRNNNTKYKIISTQIIKVKPLAKILDQYLPPNQKIDFFTIDVEGMDFEVLKSNYWQKYKPDYVLVEDTQFNIHNLHQSEIYSFLYQLKYTLIAKTKRTLIFKI